MNKAGYEERLRQRIRESFDESVEFVAKKSPDMVKDPFVGGMLVKAAIAENYAGMKESKELRQISSTLGVDFTKILEEELENALNKYLQ